MYIMETVLNIKQSNSAEIAKTLNILLADEHILYVKTRRAHWNVEGHDFLTIHRFFEDQYRQLEEMIDHVAERIRTIGHYAEATLCSFLQETHLSEMLGENNSSFSLMKSLLQDHETVISHLRDNIEIYTDEWRDAGTIDFVTGILKSHEKMAWMLRAHLIQP